MDRTERRQRLNDMILNLKDDVIPELEKAQEKYMEIKYKAEELQGLMEDVNAELEIDDILEDAREGILDQTGFDNARDELENFKDDIESYRDELNEGNAAKMEEKYQELGDCIDILDREQFEFEEFEELVEKCEEVIHMLKEMKK